MTVKQAYSRARHVQLIKKHKLIVKIASKHGFRLKFLPNLVPASM